MSPATKIVATKIAISVAGMVLGAYTLKFLRSQGLL